MVSSKMQAQAPLRSLDQRMEALKRANDIRVRRAQLKKDLKLGRVQIEEILRHPPEYVLTAKVFDMLMAVPKFGRVKAARFLNQCRISQSKTVGGLSERQRAQIVGVLRRSSSSWSPFRRGPERARSSRDCWSAAPTSSWRSRRPRERSGRARLKAASTTSSAKRSSSSAPNGTRS